MVDANTVAKRVAAADSSTGQLTRRDFDLLDGVADEREKVASFKAFLPHLLRSEVVTDISIVAYEEFSADSSAGNQEEFNLSHSLVESGAVAESVVAYEGDSRLPVDDIDPATDTVTVTPENADSTVALYYSSDEQGRIEIQKTAPSGVFETLWDADVGKLHYRDHGKEPVMFDLDRSFWQPYLPTSWTLDVYVDVPYQARWAVDVGGDGEDEPATNAALDIPIAQATQEIPGLDEMTRIDAARN